MSVFTPGPWRPVGRAIFAGDVQIGLACLPHDSEMMPTGKFVATYGESTDNAKLMAAANELLNVLCLWVVQFDGLSAGQIMRRYDTPTAVRVLATRDVIAKVLG